jgi:hypothetical protein
VRPPTRDEWKQLKKAIKEALKNFDLDTVIDTIKNQVLPDAPSGEDGTTTFSSWSTSWIRHAGNTSRNGGKTTIKVV